LFVKNLFSVLEAMFKSYSLHICLNSFSEFLPFVDTKILGSKESDETTIAPIIINGITLIFTCNSVKIEEGLLQGAITFTNFGFYTPTTGLIVNSNRQNDGLFSGTDVCVPKYTRLGNTTVPFLNLEFARLKFDEHYLIGTS